jgi:hypothetical protein
MDLSNTAILRDRSRHMFAMLSVRKVPPDGQSSTLVVHQVASAFQVLGSWTFAIIGKLLRGIWESQPGNIPVIVHAPRPDFRPSSITFDSISSVSPLHVIVAEHMTADVCAERNWTRFLCCVVSVTAE